MDTRKRLASSRDHSSSCARSSRKGKVVGRYVGGYDIVREIEGIAQAKYWPVVRKRIEGVELVGNLNANFVNSVNAGRVRHKRSVVRRQRWAAGEGIGGQLRCQLQRFPNIRGTEPHEKLWGEAGTRVKARREAR